MWTLEEKITKINISQETYYFMDIQFYANNNEVLSSLCMSLQQVFGQEKDTRRCEIILRDLDSLPCPQIFFSSYSSEEQVDYYFSNKNLEHYFIKLGFFAGAGNPHALSLEKKIRDECLELPHDLVRSMEVSGLILEATRKSIDEGSAMIELHESMWQRTQAFMQGKAQASELLDWWKTNASHIMLDCRLKDEEALHEHEDYLYYLRSSIGDTLFLSFMLRPSESVELLKNGLAFFNHHMPLYWRHLHGFMQEEHIQALAQCKPLEKYGSYLDFLFNIVYEDDLKDLLDNQLPFDELFKDNTSGKPQSLYAYFIELPNNQKAGNPRRIDFYQFTSKYFATLAMNKEMQQDSSSQKKSRAKL